MKPLKENTPLIIAGIVAAATLAAWQVQQHAPKPATVTPKGLAAEVVTQRRMIVTAYIGEDCEAQCSRLRAEAVKAGTKTVPVSPGSGFAIGLPDGVGFNNGDNDCDQVFLFFTLENYERRLIGFATRVKCDKILFSPNAQKPESLDVVISGCLINPVQPIEIKLPTLGGDK